MPAFTQVKSEVCPARISSPLPTASRIWSLLFSSLTRAGGVWGKWEVGTREKLGIVGWRTLDVRLHFGLYPLAVRPLGRF